MGSKGSYGWASSLAVRLADLDHANVRFCLQADPCTRHFVGLVLRGWENQGRDSEAFQELAGDIHSIPRRDVVRRFWGFDPGCNFMRFLARLRVPVMPRTAYDALGEVLGDPARRRLATLQTGLSAADLRTIAQCDTGLVAIVGTESLHGLGASILGHAVEAILARRSDLDRAQVLQRLRGLADPNGLGDAVLDLLADCQLPAPWPGTERIRPLCSPAAIAQIARAFRNCLGSHDIQFQAIRGEAVFYICDDGPSVAELRHDRVAGRWYLNRLLGPRNCTPSKRVSAKVVGAFEASGFHQINSYRLPWAEVGSWP